MYQYKKKYNMCKEKSIYLISYFESASIRCVPACPTFATRDTEANEIELFFSFHNVRQ
jgi:hypothetical protein